MSLLQESLEFQGQAKQRLGDKFAIVEQEMQRLADAGIAQRAKKVGDFAPDFTLPNATGEPVSLSALLGRGPVVLTFYRGSWCPFCVLELRAYRQILPQIQEHSATLVAISPEKPDFSQAMIEAKDLTFPVLSDFGNTVARGFGLVFQVSDESRALSQNVFKNDLQVRNGDSSWEIPMPGTFVIDTHRVIRFAHVDPNYQTGRAEPADVLKALSDLSSMQSRMEMVSTR